MTSFNPQLFRFAIDTLFRFFSKNSFVVIVYTLLVMLLASLFFIQTSIRYEMQKVSSNFPDIVLENQKALRYTTIDTTNMEKILDVYGVADVQARVYGRYNFKQAEQAIFITGIDPFENQHQSLFQNLVEQYQFAPYSMVVAKKVQELMEQYYYKVYFNFLTPSLVMKRVMIEGSFVSEDVENQYSCVMTKEDAREILGFQENEATDLAVYLSNKNEILTVVSKLQQLYPNVKIVTQEDKKMELESFLDYDSGIFISLFIISLFTFFMIVYDKAAGISSSEKREIGILKALGWRVEDVLRVKLYEAVLLSLFSYILGVVLALIYVYLFDAIYMKDIFLNIIGVEEISGLQFMLDIKALFIVFLLSTPIYIAATLIPSWRVATTDADEVMR